jgi:hypothetical protein
MKPMKAVEKTTEEEWMKIQVRKEGHLSLGECVDGLHLAAEERHRWVLSLEPIFQVEEETLS